MSWGESGSAGLHCIHHGRSHFPRPCSCNRASCRCTLTWADLQGLLALSLHTVLAQLQQQQKPACRSEGDLLRQEKGEGVKSVQIGKEGSNTVCWGMTALQGSRGDHHLLIATSPGYEVRAQQSCHPSLRFVTFAVNMSSAAPADRELCSAA